MNNMQNNPSNRCNELLRQVSETGFAMSETAMYLDTHPYDTDALNYYNYICSMHREASAAYEKQCGPLTLSGAGTRKDYWQWVDGPWPWEGGK